jgi:hypothetical protein
VPELRGDERVQLRYNAGMLFNDKRTVKLPEEFGRELFRVEVGSGLHGVAIPGTDDRDEMGVCLERPEYFAGLKKFETYTWRTKPAGVRSEAGDLDLTIHSYRKFIRLALNGNPTIVQVFFAPRDKVVFGETATLPWLAERVVSKRAGRAYLGYLTAQKMRLTGERGQKDVNRPELVKKYGFDRNLRCTQFGLDFKASNC